MFVNMVYVALLPHVYSLHFANLISPSIVLIAVVFYSTD